MGVSSAMPTSSAPSSRAFSLINRVTLAVSGTGAGAGLTSPSRSGVSSSQRIMASRQACSGRFRRSRLNRGISDSPRSSTISLINGSEMGCLNFAMPSMARVYRAIRSYNGSAVQAQRLSLDSVECGTFWRYVSYGSKTTIELPRH